MIEREFLMVLLHFYYFQWQWFERWCIWENLSRSWMYHGQIPSYYCYVRTPLKICYSKFCKLKSEATLNSSHFELPGICVVSCTCIYVYFSVLANAQKWSSEWDDGKCDVCQSGDIPSVPQMEILSHQHTGIHRYGNGETYYYILLFQYSLQQNFDNSYFPHLGQKTLVIFHKILNILTNGVNVEKGYVFILIQL